MGKYLVSFVLYLLEFSSAEAYLTLSDKTTCKGEIMTPFDLSGAQREEMLESFLSISVSLGISRRTKIFKIEQS